MNIEQKNTLFVVSLVLVVLTSVAAMSYFLIGRHVSEQIDSDLTRAHAVFVEAQKQGFQNLRARARVLSSEPSLTAASLTGDSPTIKGMLEELAKRTGTDLLVVYRRAGADAVAAVSNRFHLTSPQVLSSPSFRSLVRKAGQSNAMAFGHALALDTFLRLVAVPIRNPLGGRLGMLLLGKEFTPSEVGRLHELVRAEIVLYKANVVLGTSLTALDDSLDSISARARANDLVHFDAGGKRYYGRVYPILARANGPVLAQMLLAVPADTQWSTYRALFKNATYFSLLILLFAALLGIWISRSWLTRPLKELARVTAAIGRGDLDVKVDESRRDELGELARSFSYMLERLKVSQAEEAQSKYRFHNFAESTSDWLWETNEHGQFSYVSQTVVSILAMPADALLGHTFAQVFARDNMHEVTRLLQPTGREVMPFKDVEIWITADEGMRLCLRLNGMPYFDGATLKGFRGTARDITKVKNDEERLINLATRDHLTGLSNRRRFMEDLAREVAVARRQSQSGALLLIDLDHFKLVNDTAGHAAGDEVIIQVGGLLRRLARNVDLVARLSGDEFAIALIHANLEQAAKRAAEILNHISQLRPMYAGKILNTSASIGIVVYPQHGKNPVELLAKADTAMYAAKSAGRNRAHLYSEDDMAQQLMGSQLTWKERIHEALEHDLFTLVFQPIVSTRGNPGARYEVLVRLRGTDGILHPPGSFIPTAEQFGLIRQVDTVVVRKAIRTLAAQPENDPPVAFSINLSGLSVGDDGMMRLIEKELKAAPVDRRRIIFEITESAACQDINRAMDFIARIQHMGCRMALDDFGVGFSSFSYLKHLNADILKIDGSFIRDIQNSKEDQLFVKALVDVARGMGMQTTAEFVESEASLEMVRKLGVDHAQGYHIGKPVSVLPGQRQRPAVN